MFTFNFLGESCEFGSAKYYALCGFGGILSCGITHTAVVPLDLVKCRIQVGKNKQTKQVIKVNDLWSALHSLVFYS